jgi:hypothetical protein
VIRAVSELSAGEARDLLLSAAAVLAALAVIGRLIVLPIVRFAQRLERVMTNVEQQLYPNGGSTLRDAVNRIQEHLGIEDTAPKNDPNHEHHERNHP